MKNKWIFTATLLISVLSISSCGGGGGGSRGGDKDSGPANTQTLPEDLQTGLFTDAPVTGLRYVQGPREGYTVNGQFTYDANSSKPICFYIGKLLLGCSDGSTVITPYDLSSSGQPASLQSGYNISRLLISLDESSEPEIELPQNTENVMGSINFGLSDGEFATDAVVNDLIERYAPSGSLVTRQDVDAHIAGNADVKQAIDNLQDNLDFHIASIDIQWNSSLVEPGVLAHIEAKPQDQNQRSEHLYLELDSGDSDLYLARLVHVDAQGKYTYVTLKEDGYPFKVSNNGRTYAYINMLDTTLESMIATSSYQPERGGYLIGEGGLSDREETTYISDQKAVEILAAVARLTTGEFDKDDLLRIASHGASYIRGVACSSASSECYTYLEDALLLAEVDSVYNNQKLSWEATALSTKLCLPLSTVTESENCSHAPNLEEFNVVLSQRMDSYAGGIEVDLPLVPFSYTHSVQMRDWVGDIVVQYEFYCSGRYTLYKFADDTYYYGVKPGVSSCQPYDPEIFGGRLVYICYLPSGQTRTDCEDFLGFDEWPDFEKKLELALKVTNRLTGHGLGQRLAYWGTWDYENVPYSSYFNYELLEAFRRFPDGPYTNPLAWLNSLKVNTDQEDYFVSGPFKNNIGEYDRTPLGSQILINPDNTSDNLLFSSSGLKFRDRNGLEVQLDIYGASYF